MPVTQPAKPPVAVKSPSKMQAIEAHVAGINAKKVAGLDRVHQLLIALPLEVRAQLDQRELKNGVAISNKNKAPDKAVIQSPGPGMYCWNGSNAVTEPVILEKIVGLASR
jgi:hypothetical protein